jgi:hypothetical protein
MLPSSIVTLSPFTGSVLLGHVLVLDQKIASAGLVFGGGKVLGSGGTTQSS